ncbi:MAG: aminotransferase [Candidatus Cloacimonadota bacterium]|nr:MAG: aminotransferase [Candidatus Cloacimonadota bacterium]PIE78961.1 MAG: aminotransferase [Candidatus Delongbacteria bacterium]
MKITSKKRNLVIENNGNKIVEIQYRNWISNKVKTKLNGQTIEIKNKTIWRSELEIFKNSKKIGDITFKWNGNAIIKILNDKEEAIFSLKAKGFMKPYFELRNEESELVFVLKSSFKWRKMNYDFEVESIQNIYDENRILELLIYTAIVSRRYMINIAGAAGGAA